MDKEVAVLKVGCTRSQAQLCHLLTEISGACLGPQLQLFLVKWGE